MTCQRAFAGSRFTDNCCDLAAMEEKEAALLDLVTGPSHKKAELDPVYDMLANVFSSALNLILNHYVHYQSISRHHYADLIKCLDISSP